MAPCIALLVLSGPCNIITLHCYLVAPSTLNTLQEWRVLLELLQGYEDTVAEVAKFGAAVAAHKAKMKSNREPPTWQQLAARLTAEDLRAAVRKARTSAGSAVWDSGAGAAVAAAERDGLLSTLPAAALLTEVTDAGTAASEAGGWLRPLKFNPEQHRCSTLTLLLMHTHVAAACSV